jgi:hypothetical protein
VNSEKLFMPITGVTTEKSAKSGHLGRVPGKNDTRYIGRKEDRFKINGPLRFKKFGTTLC